MPVFEAVTIIACPPQAVFDFLARPSNLARVTPQGLHLKLIDGPERLTLGARITARGSKFGIPQTITSEVIAFEEGVQFTDAQVKGPFAKFVHTHRVEPAPEGTRMTDTIEYEAPGGLVGLILTNDRIRNDLVEMLAYRAGAFKELLEGSGRDAGTGRAE
jgi:ligand-binding SRPBCC domain-containing protein